MKKKLLSAIFILSVTFTFSQILKSAKYGVRAGLNISNLDFEPDPTFTNLHRNGFYFGGFVEQSLNNSMYLNAELQWSAEGAKESSLRANYINLPVQLRFKLGDNFMLGAGPQASLKTWEANDNFKTFTVSMLGGVEYKFKEDFFVDVRAVYGLSNILDNDLAPQEATQVVLQFGIGMKL